MGDDDPLARAYNRALTLEKAGELDAAAEAYRVVLRLDPEDRGGASVRLAGMGRGPVPETAPEAYVATLFDQNAAVFDDVLVGQLGYAVPMMVRERLIALGLGPFGATLDLGCGTGLTGVSLADMAGPITGVDLAEAMLEEADERDCYEALYVGEAVAFLEESGEGPWSLITATDVLPYMGALERFFAAAAAELIPGGVLVFSTETLPAEAFGGADYTVGKGHRFAHDPDYIGRLMTGVGLECRDARPITVRTENGVPVPGELIVAVRP